VLEFVRRLLPSFFSFSYILITCEHLVLRNRTGDGYCIPYTGNTWLQEKMVCDVRLQIFAQYVGLSGSANEEMCGTCILHMTEMMHNQLWLEKVKGRLLGKRRRRWEDTIRQDY